MYYSTPVLAICLSMAMLSPGYADTAFDHMHYFILDPAQQLGVARGTSYVVLIGGAEERRFQVSFQGTVTNVGPAQRRRRLVVLLEQSRRVAGKVVIATIPRKPSQTAINQRFIAECVVPFSKIDQVEARIEQ